MADRTLEEVAKQLLSIIQPQGIVTPTASGVEVQTSAGKVAYPFQRSVRSRERNI